MDCVVVAGVPQTNVQYFNSLTCKREEQEEEEERERKRETDRERERERETERGKRRGTYV